MTTSQRVVDLACDRALWGLDPAEDMELVSSLPPGTDLDTRLALVAAAIALSELEIDEPLPAHLADRAFAAAMSSAPARSLGRAGTIPMPGRPAVTPMPSGPALTPLAFLPSANDGPRPSLAPSKVTSIRPGAAKAKPSPLTWVGWLAAAACLMLAAGTYWKMRRPVETTEVAETFSAKRDRMLAEAKDVVRIPWAPTEDRAAKGASGEIAWSNARQEGYMTFRSLAPNDPTKEQYQLWIFDAQRDEAYPVDGGVFDVGPSGEVVVPIHARVAVGTPKLFAVTVERPGGVVVSKRERIVVAATVKG